MDQFNIDRLSWQEMKQLEDVVHMKTGLSDPLIGIVTQYANLPHLPIPPLSCVKDLLTLYSEEEEGRHVILTPQERSDLVDALEMHVPVSSICELILSYTSVIPSLFSSKWKVPPVFVLHTKNPMILNAWGRLSFKFFSYEHQRFTSALDMCIDEFPLNFKTHSKVATPFISNVNQSGGILQDCEIGSTRQRHIVGIYPARFTAGLLFNTGELFFGWFAKKTRFQYRVKFTAVKTVLSTDVGLFIVSTDDLITLIHSCFGKIIFCATLSKIVQEAGGIKDVVFCSALKTLVVLTRQGLVKSYILNSGMSNGDRFKDIKFSSIVTSKASYACLSTDGRVIANNDIRPGDLLPKCDNQKLHNIKHLYANSAAFVALTLDNDIIVWGNLFSGGYISQMNRETMRGKIVSVSVANKAFCALLTDGSCFAWGKYDEGGTIPFEISQEIKKQKALHVFTNQEGFAVVTKENKILTWGRRYVTARNCLSYWASRVDEETIPGVYHKPHENHKDQILETDRAMWLLDRKIMGVYSGRANDSATCFTPYQCLAHHALDVQNPFIWLQKCPVVFK